MKKCYIVIALLCISLSPIIKTYASSVKIEENETTLEEPEEEYFEEQTDENTVTAKKTKTLTVTREEDYWKVNKRIFIGDSRTLGMCLAVTDLTYTEEKTIKSADENGNLWICRTGEGLTWMMENDDIENEIIEGTDIYILMGVNDCRHNNLWHLYRDYINEKKAAWESLGARLIFVSVLPLAQGARSTTTNDDVTGFNDYMKMSISARYYDLCGIVEQDAEFSSDGIHYTEDEYVKIYEMLIEYQEE